MIEKMKIMILFALIGMSVTFRVHQSEDKSNKTLVTINSFSNTTNNNTVANSTGNYVKVVAIVDNIDLYYSDYRPTVTTFPVGYGANQGTYYIPSFSYTYSWNPPKCFFYSRKSGEDTSQSEEASRTVDIKKTAGKENAKQEKIQVNVKELESKMKKLKLELWGDENKKTDEIRSSKKAYDPAWLVYQLNIATVLQLEDLLKENKSNSKNPK